MIDLHLILTKPLAKLVEKSAKKNHRSLPSEIRFQLERAYEPSTTIETLASESRQVKDLKE